MEIKIRSRNNIFRLALERIRLPKAWTTGTMNRCEDGKYIVYLDYDLIEEDYLKGELAHLQAVFDVGDFFVFQSSPKKYHAISFSKMTALEYVRLLENSSADELFKKIPRYVSYRNWVLRHFEKAEKNKPKYLYTLANTSNRQESYAHFKFLKTFYPDIPINKLKNSDCLTKLDIITYKTGNV